MLAEIGSSTGGIRHHHTHARTVCRKLLLVRFNLERNALANIKAGLDISSLRAKSYANHLSGIQAMATISLQCNSLS